VKPGDSVEVQVQEIKDVQPTRPGGPTKKITLSLKALTADPWTELDIVEGRVIAGTVVRVTEFGRFVRLAPAIEGLLHVSELGKGAKVEEGEEIRVVVKKIDRNAKKISLVLAPEGAEAGTTVTTGISVKVGAVVSGVVERIETYGIFVQVDGTKGQGRPRPRPARGARRSPRDRSAKDVPGRDQGHGEGPRDGRGPPAPLDQGRARRRGARRLRGRARQGERPGVAGHVRGSAQGPKALTDLV
jgi:predicted RNA-binding protein with RPS1 domain